MAYAQLSELAPQLPVSTIVLMDRGYDSDWLWCKLSTLALSGSWEGHDASGKAVQVTWWQHLALQHADWLELSVIRVERPQASNTKRDPRISWFVWVGDQDVDLISIALSYVHRFSHEHGYRFDKQSLLWDKVRVRTPEQFERWSLLVAIVHNQLVLSRALVEPSLHPYICYILFMRVSFVSSIVY